MKIYISFNKDFGFYVSVFNDLSPRIVEHFNNFNFVHV